MLFFFFFFLFVLSLGFIHPSIYSSSHSRIHSFSLRLKKRIKTPAKAHTDYHRPGSGKNSRVWLFNAEPAGVRLPRAMRRCGA
ncbi:hypothetical protein GGR50DRAFT_684432 [Xylaria sp. CBS 124048]|nr:hypothetical protein GGR50DRAFT_684432 [Xylaria sp. CBS 124048]